MKKYISIVIALVLVAFGLLTLFLSTSLIFDLFDVRADQGNYVLFVVWANFFSSIIYLIAAFGFLAKKYWTTLLLGLTSFYLFATFIRFLIYVSSGGIHETKTMSALVFRIAVTLIFTILGYYLISKKKKNEN